MNTNSRLMKMIIVCVLLLTSIYPALADKKSNNSGLKTFYDFTVKNIDGVDYPLSKLKGKKVIVVNTASKCGLTPQYETLQKIYDTLDKTKFEIIAFPANNFLSQEPGTSTKIKEFCQANYGVTFPIMAKVSVCNYVYTSYPPDPAKATETTTDEIYQWLTQKSQNGVLDTKIQWNFQKFLIDENGHLVGTIAPNIVEEIWTIKTWLEAK